MARGRHRKLLDAQSRAEPLRHRGLDGFDRRAEEVLPIRGVTRSDEDAPTVVDHGHGNRMHGLDETAADRADDHPRVSNSPGSTRPSR